MQAITSKVRFDIRQTWPSCFHLFQTSTICCFFIFNYVDFLERKKRTEQKCIITLNKLVETTWNIKYPSNQVAFPKCVHGVVKFL